MHCRGVPGAAFGSNEWLGTIGGRGGVLTCPDGMLGRRLRAFLHKRRVPVRGLVESPDPLPRGLGDVRSLSLEWLDR